MRPVNLIPPEQRRGERAPARTGPASYAVVAVLALLLVGVVATVMTNNSISDHKAEITTLEAQEAQAMTRADALRPYAEFAAMHEARAATVTSLAESRFDWERVMRELAIVIPSDVWLIDLTGTVSPEVVVAGAEGESDLRSAIAGPALEIKGCGASHDAVAAFAAALEDIDGVTRVGVAKSEKPEASSAVGSAPSAAGSSADGCATRDFIAEFEIVVAFDEVQVPTIETQAPTPPPGGDVSAADSSAVADGAAQQGKARSSAGSQTQKANEAVNLVPGAVR